MLMLKFVLTRGTAVITLHKLRCTTVRPLSAATVSLLSLSLFLMRCAGSSTTTGTTLQTGALTGALARTWTPTRAATTLARW